MVDKIVEESTEITTEMTVIRFSSELTLIRSSCMSDIEGVTVSSSPRLRPGPERGHFPEIMAIIELEAQVIVDPGQDPELVQIGIEYIVISVGNMITSQENVPLLERKLQRMLNLGDEETVTPSMSDMQEDLIRVSSEENLRANPLNL